MEECCAVLQIRKSTFCLVLSSIATAANLMASGRVPNTISRRILLPRSLANVAVETAERTPNGKDPARTDRTAGGTPRDHRIKCRPVPVKCRFGAGSAGQPRPHAQFQRRA